MELGSGSPTDLADLSDTNDFIDADNRVRNLIVGGVIGAGALLTLCLFIVCGILHCYFTSDKGIIVSFIHSGGTRQIAVAILIKAINVPPRPEVQFLSSL